MKGLVALHPYVGDKTTREAMERAEPVVPEVKLPMLLTKIAQLASSRGHRPGASGANDDLAFLLDTLRVLRIFGDLLRDGGMSIRDIGGDSGQRPPPCSAGSQDTGSGAQQIRR